MISRNHFLVCSVILKEIAFDILQTKEGIHISSPLLALMRLKLVIITVSVYMEIPPWIN